MRGRYVKLFGLVAGELPAAGGRSMPAKAAAGRFFLGKSKIGELLDLKTDFFRPLRQTISLPYKQGRESVGQGPRLQPGACVLQVQTKRPLADSQARRCHFDRVAGCHQCEAFDLARGQIKALRGPP